MNLKEGWKWIYSIFHFIKNSFDKMGSIKSRILWIESGFNYLVIYEVNIYNRWVKQRLIWKEEAINTPSEYFRKRQSNIGPLPFFQAFSMQYFPNTFLILSVFFEACYSFSRRERRNAKFDNDWVGWADIEKILFRKNVGWKYIQKTNKVSSYLQVNSKRSG